MIRKADRVAFLESIKSDTHLRLITHPNIEEPVDIFADADLTDELRRLQVYVSGDTFPKVRWEKSDLQQEDDYLEGYYESRARSMFRLYRSGQFVYFSTLEELDQDVQVRLEERLQIDEELKKQIDVYVDYLWNVQRFVEYYAFVARLAKRSALQTNWNVDIKFKTTKVCAFSVLDFGNAGFWNPYYFEGERSIKQIIPIADVALEPSEHCVKAVLEFEKWFKLESRPDTTIGWVKKFTQGR